MSQQLPSAHFSAPLSESDRRKAAVTFAAADLVKSGMILGLGSGTTAAFFLYELANRLRDGAVRDIIGVPTSNDTAALAKRLEIPLTTLEDHPQLDLAVDGADEVDPHGNVIKGGGGALLREKIVAQAARVLVIVVDDGKCSPMLGTQWALPIEVIPFGWQTQANYIKNLGAEVTLRTQAESAFLTDQGNYILDAKFAPRADWSKIAAALNTRAGIVEHGLFLSMAQKILIAHDSEVMIQNHRPAVTSPGPRNAE